MDDWENFFREKSSRRAVAARTTVIAVRTIVGAAFLAVVMAILNFVKPF